MLKQFISIMAVVSLSLGLFFNQIRKTEVRSVKEQLALSEMAQIKLQERLLTTFFVGHFADVEIISELHELKKFAITENNYSRRSLKLDFLAFSSKRKSYDEIRFLDETGMEKIRVNFRDGKTLLVPDKELQDKSSRYYFKQILQLEPGQIYLSPLDLNLERHKIERPFKPVLRIGMSISDQYADSVGVLVVNYLAASMLRAFRKGAQDAVGENSLLNHNGFWLSSETPENEWGFMLSSRRSANFGQRYPRAWKKIIAAKNGQFSDSGRLFTFSTFNPLALRQHLVTGAADNEASGSYPWKIVSLVPKTRLETMIAQRLKEKELIWLTLFALFSLISGSLLWIALRSREKEQQRILRINAELEEKVKARTREIYAGHKRLTAILETTEQGFVLFDRELKIIEINPALLKMLGRTYDDCMGRSPYYLFGEENRAIIRQKAIRRRKGFSDSYDLVVTRDDGSLFRCHITATPLIDEENRFTGSFALISDIGERLEYEHNLKKAKLEAEKNSAAKTLFLSSMSHEFRTPMNSILGFSQLLQEEKSLNRKQRDFVEKILVSGEHLKQLIDDILDLARIEAGAVKINKTNIDLCSTMHELIAITSPMALEGAVELVAKEPKTHYLVRADQLRLEQIVLNLLSNAIKYNRPGGRVEVFCAKKSGQKLRLNVVDDGPGIAPEQLPFLFEPFNRLGAETSTIQGSGVGLAISRNLAELMGCQLGLLESRKGTGCHFYLDLPLVGNTTTVADEPVQESEVGSASLQVGAPAIKSCTLLYIEDNELNRMLMVSIIEQRPSFRLCCAVDGGQGIEMALDLRPDLILADIGLPDIDGFAVLDKLQRQAETSEIPVVALSGNATKEDIEKAYAAGFVGYLTKPVNIGHLFATIDDILSQK